MTFVYQHPYHKIAFCGWLIVVCFCMQRGCNAARSLLIKGILFVSNNNIVLMIYDDIWGGLWCFVVHELSANNKVCYTCTFNFILQT